MAGRRPWPREFRELLGLVLVVMLATVSGAARLDSTPGTKSLASGTTGAAKSGRKELITDEVGILLSLINEADSTHNDKDGLTLVSFEVSTAKGGSAEDWLLSLQDDLELHWVITAGHDEHCRPATSLLQDSNIRNKCTSAIAVVCRQDAPMLLTNMLEQGTVAFKALHHGHQSPSAALKDLLHGDQENPEGQPTKKPSQAKDSHAKPAANLAASSEFFEALGKPTQASSQGMAMSKPWLVMDAAVGPKRRLMDQHTGDHAKSGGKVQDVDARELAELLAAVDEGPGGVTLVHDTPAYPPAFPLPSEPEPPSPSPTPSPSPFPPPSPSPPLSPPPPPATLQPIAPLDYEGNTYSLRRLNSGDLSYDAADDECCSNGDNLVTVSDDGEQAGAVEELVSRFFNVNPQASTLEFWTGYKVVGGSVQALDGTTASSEISLPSSGSGLCVYYSVERGSTGSYLRGDCADEKPYMCEESECSTCDVCVSRWYNEFTNHITIGSSSAILDEFATVCDQLDYPGSDCDDVQFRISSSVKDEEGVYNLARRPAAICSLLGDCAEGTSCNVRGDGGLRDIAERMDFCTADGTESDTFIGSREFPAGNDGDCFTSSDCSGGQFCDFDESVATTVRKCDPSTGLDSSKIRGICASLCDLHVYVERKETLGTLFTADDVCSTPGEPGQCGDGKACQQPTDSCVKPNTASCTANPDGTVDINPGEPCDGQCYVLTKVMTGAQFSNSGEFINVALSTRAKPLDRQCSDIFDDATSELLGSSSCTVDDDDLETLQITLAGDATIEPADTLQLKSDTLLSAYLISEGSDATFDADEQDPISVDSCGRACEQPTASITGTTSRINELCAGDDSYDPIIVDGQDSSSPDGRYFQSVVWGTFSSDPDCVSTSELQSDITSANNGGTLSMELSNAALKALEVNKLYCITLTVTSILGVQSNTAEHTLRKEALSQSRPVVTADVDDTYTLPSPSGLRLSGSVSVLSVCPDTKVLFKWTCDSIIDNDGVTQACGVLDGQESWSEDLLTRVGNADLSSAGVVPGYKLIFTLAARFESAAETDAASESVEVTIEGADIIAAFAPGTPQGSVSRGNSEITFDASDSEDPSDPNGVEPLRFSFACFRANGFSSCFTDTLYTGVQDGAVWTIDGGKLLPDADLNDGELLTILADVTKGERFAIATTTIQPVPETQRIISFNIIRDCDGTCPTTHRSSLPLAIYTSLADGLSEDVQSITWTLDGEDVRENDLVGGDADVTDRGDVVDASSISLSSGVLPTTGVITIACTVTVSNDDGTTDSGTSQMSVRLSGPPVCGRPNGCLELSPSTNEMPNIKFLARATGFSSELRMTYEFGYMDDGAQVVVQPSSRSPTQQLYAVDGPRTYEIYVVAISADGSRSEPFMSDFVLEENTEIDQAQLDDLAAEIDFERLASTGDNSIVLGGVKEMNGYFNGGGSGGSGQSTQAVTSMGGMRRLLSRDATIDEALTQLENILANEASDVPEALDVLASVRDTFRQQDPSLQQSVRVARIARDALEILDDSGLSTIGSATIGNGLGLAGMTAEMLAGKTEETSWATAQRLIETIELAGSALRRNSPAGVTTFANSSQIGLGVSRNTRIETPRASIVVDGVLAFGRSSPVPIKVSMPAGAAQTAFKEWCSASSDCSSLSILTLFITYMRDSEILRAAAPGWKQTLIDHFSFDSLDPAPVSGILEVQFPDFKSEDAAICDGALDRPCAFDLTIPIIPEGTEDVPSFEGRSLACVRLRREEDTETFEADVIEATIAYDGLATSATCRTQQLGKHMLVSYNAPPAPNSPPPSPSIPEGMAPPPSPPAQPTQGTPPTSQCGTDATPRASVRAVFDLDFPSNDNDEFRSRLLADIRINMHEKFRSSFSHGGPSECPNYITLDRFVPGSIIADMSIDLGAGKSSDDAEAFENTLKNLSEEEAKELFDNTDLKQSLSGTFKATEEESQQDDGDDSGNDAEVLGPAIAIPVFFFLLALAAVAYFAYKKNKVGSLHVSERQRNPDQV